MSFPQTSKIFKLYDLDYCSCVRVTRCSHIFSHQFIKSLCSEIETELVLILHCDLYMNLQDVQAQHVYN
ncbi:hypothetical protein N665_0676s0042 [Sinapis alba]|nr:hypothetical protein N665_0676s0042 [Sinapis alba]